jgi:hypothetical protein
MALIQTFGYRRLWTGALVTASAFGVYGIWVAFMKWHVGGYHNAEMEEYRQFIWMLDCARAHIGSCGPIAARHLTTFFNVSVPVLAIPLLLAFLCRLARTVFGQNTPVGPAQQALARSIALTLLVTLAFLALMGFYAQRLCWLLVPPVVLMATLDCYMVRAGRPVRWPWLFDAALVASCMAYLLVLAGRAGPYD